MRVRISYIQTIQYMYEGVSTSVGTHGRDTNDFHIRIWLHQSLTISPYIFTLVFTLVLDVLGLLGSHINGHKEGGDELGGKKNEIKGRDKFHNH